jgi:hypothetical protein
MHWIGVGIGAFLGDGGVRNLEIGFWGGKHPMVLRNVKTVLTL